MFFIILMFLSLFERKKEYPEMVQFKEAMAHLEDLSKQEKELRLQMEDSMERVKGTWKRCQDGVEELAKGLNQDATEEPEEGSDRARGGTPLDNSEQQVE
jgi:hypothetical protein